MIITVDTKSSQQISEYQNIHHYCYHHYDHDYDHNHNDEYAAQSEAGGQKDSVATTKSLHVTNLLIDRGPSRSYR